MNRVAIAKAGQAGYPESPPFHPDRRYPEYPFGDQLAASPNGVYDTVRRALHALKLDEAAFGSPAWNPLGRWVRPGMTVLVKPNLVLDRHPRGGDLHCLITHGSLVRALLDYVLIALEGKGRVVIGDAPLQGTRFDEAVRQAGHDRVLDFLSASTPVSLGLRDFRQVAAEVDERHHVRGWSELPGDAAGYATFDLGDQSMLAPIADQSDRFRVSNYRVEDTLQYHNRHSHRYVVAGSVFDADVIINVPKLKTHCKAGVTLALKNFVGTVGRKQCLAHHRQGGADAGGDEYPRDSVLKGISVALENRIDGCPGAWVRTALSLCYRVNERLIRIAGVDGLRDGGWHGNDTVWRMVLDLVRIPRYGRRDGTMAVEPQRTILSFLDGIVAGENEGPLECTPVHAGVLVAGENPVAVDLAATTLMGFDWRAIPLLRSAVDLSAWPLLTESPDAIRVLHQGASLSLEALAASPLLPLPFTPAAGWLGHVELNAPGGMSGT